MEHATAIPAAPFVPPPAPPRRVVARLLTLKASAVYLSTSVRQLWEWRRAGKLRAIYLDRRPRFDREDLDQLVATAKAEGAGHAS